MLICRGCSQVYFWKDSVLNFKNENKDSAKTQLLAKTNLGEQVDINIVKFRCSKCEAVIAICEYLLQGRDVKSKTFYEPVMLHRL